MKNYLKRSNRDYRLSPLVANSILITPFVIVFIAILGMSMAITRPFSEWILLENRPVELVTFLSLLAAGVIGFELSWRAKKNKLGSLIVGFYILFSFGLLVVGMEEESWGQWIFWFDPPEAVKAINKQHEMNLHNLPALHAPFEYLRVAFGVGGLIGVWLSFRPQTRYIGAPVVLSSWFVLIAVLGTIDLFNYYETDVQQRNFMETMRMTEVLEMLIGLAALMYMWLNRRLFLHEQRK